MCRSPIGSVSQIFFKKKKSLSRCLFFQKEWLGRPWNRSWRFAADRPFAVVSSLAVVSKTSRRVSLNALKTAHQGALEGSMEGHYLIL